MLTLEQFEEAFESIEKIRQISSGLDTFCSLVGDGRCGFGKIEDMFVKQLENSMGETDHDGWISWYLYDSPKDEKMVKLKNWKKHKNINTVEKLYNLIIEYNG